MERDIERIERRTRGYWYEDGLGELGLGLLFALLGLAFWVEEQGLAGPFSSGFSSVALPFILIGGGLVMRYALRSLKERITYPRTGYVAYRHERSPRRKLASGIIAAAVAAVVTFLAINTPASLRWIPLLQGALIAAALLYLQHLAGLARFYALALVALALGTIAALSGLGDTLGSAVFFGGLGIAMMVSGAWALAGYLQRHRPPTEQ